MTVLYPDSDKDTHMWAYFRHMQTQRAMGCDSFSCAVTLTKPSLMESPPLAHHTLYILKLLHCTQIHQMLLKAAVTKTAKSSL